MKQRKSNGSQILNVPNTPEGQQFIKLLRKYSHDVRLRVRGRGCRKEYAKIVGAYTAKCSIPPSYSQWMAVYAKPVRKRVVSDELANKDCTISQLSGEIQLLKYKLANIKEQAYNIYNG